MKVIVAMLVAVVAGLAYTVPALAGDEEAKVFVCKYVGTPGVDETLQTGQNPISVSVSAVNGAAVGSFFNDSQGRSFVLALDVGQDPPGVDQCPPPDNPPPVDVCTNIDGVQTEVPEGFHAGEDENGRPICIEDEPPPPVDVCPNLEGNQAEVPPGFGIVNGECVPVVINPQCAPPQVFNPLTGLCEGGGLPPTPPTPRGVAGVFCDSGAKLYRIVGTIDGFAVDSVVPPTIAGNVKGVTNVTLRRGDTTFRTSVTTNGDCDTTVPTVSAPLTPPVVVGTPAKPAPPVVVTPKPKPARKPVAKKKKVVTHKAKPKPKPTVHICKPVNGHKRVWIKAGPEKGCQFVGKPEPSHLTG